MNKMLRVTKIIAFAGCIFLTFTLLRPLFGEHKDKSATPIAPHAQIQNVIFDMHGVLLSVNKKKIARQFGLLALLRYLFTLHTSRDLKKKLYEVAHRVKPLDPDAPAAHDDKGNQLPQLFLDWQRGIYPAPVIRDALLPFVDENPQFFASKLEQRIIRGIIWGTFTPKIMTNAVQLIPEGVELVQWCKQQGMRVFILSNFDPGGFEIINQNFPELFALFDEHDIFISGQLGIMKPDPQIYEHLLDKHNLDPATCVFFDDQKENIEAAQKCGINGIWVQKKNGWFSSWQNIASARKTFEQGLELGHAIA